MPPRRPFHTLEAGGENEQIGVVIERGKTFGRYGAKHCDPVGKPCWDMLT